MKKALIILILFALFTVLVCNFAVITDIDRSIIIFLQHKLNISPEIAAILTSKKLYYGMIYLPIIIWIVYFIINKLYYHIAVLIASPYIAYGFNTIFKNIIARPRPPIELQLGTHSISYSYVSNHTLIMTCLWGMIIFYTNKYCKNAIIRRIITIFSFLWIIFSGLSRILLGVHNPTDVIGAYILGSFFLMVYIKTANLISKRFEQ